MNDQIKIELAADAILRAVRRNAKLTAECLKDELQRCAIDGWLHLAAVRACNTSQWSGAMERVIKQLDDERQVPYGC